MALTRTELAEMGLTSEQIEQVIKGHTASTEYLKDQIAKKEDEIKDYKKRADKADDLQKKLDGYEAAGGDWKKKYEDEHSAFESYKSEIETGKAKKAKEEAYSALLRETGVSEKRIPAVLKVADLAGIELGEDGKIKDAEKLTESIKTEWSDFIVKTEESGADTKTPPGTDPEGSKPATVPAFF